MINLEIWAKALKGLNKIMAHQKEADLDVLLSMKEFLDSFETVDKRQEKAKAKYSKSIQGFIDSANRSLEVYYNNKKNK